MGARNNAGLKAIAKLRRRTKIILWAEALIKNLSMPAGILAAYLVMALFGLGNAWLFGICMVLSVVLAGYGVWNLPQPSAQIIDRRIEAASGWRHRPLAALYDQPENTDAAGLQLWQAHRARIIRSLAHGRAGFVVLHAAGKDVFALRGLLLLAILCGFIIAGNNAAARLSSAFTLPAWPFAGPQVTAWISPPSYAGASPHILQPGQSFSTLPGAQLALVIGGIHHRPTVYFGQSRLRIAAVGAHSYRGDMSLSTSGILLVGPWWHRLGRWRIHIVPPTPPVIILDQASVTDVNSVKLHWRITDHYGIESLSVVFRPAAAPLALSQNFAWPSPNVEGAAVINLAETPFGGLPLTVSLQACNLAGICASKTAAQSFSVPGLDLHNKTARMLAGFRQHLAVTPQDTRTVAAWLQQISMTPASAISASADVEMSALAAAIWLHQINAADATRRLLALELQIEAGPDYQAAQQLAKADQALTAALARGLAGHAPNAANLQKLLAAMQNAASAHIAALQAASGAGGSGTENLSALANLAQQIAADEAAGRNALATRELQQLEQALAALQSAQLMSAAQRVQSMAAEAAAQAVGEMTQGEAALLDKTQAGIASQQSQAKLQSQLAQTISSLAQTGLQLPGLPPAARAMQAAKVALIGQDQSGAEAAEAATIMNLQQAAAALAAAAKRQMAVSPGSQPGMTPENGDGGQDGAPDEQADPNFSLGKANQAGAIQNQIIKLDSSPALPPATHQYYQQLLEQP